MLAKISRGNQITIPKEVIEKAHWTRSCEYVDVQCSNGTIQLKPVTVEEEIPTVQFEKFAEWALRKEAGDKSFKSAREASKYLKRQVTGH